MGAVGPAFSGATGQFNRQDRRKGYGCKVAFHDAQYSYGIVGRN